MQSDLRTRVREALTKSREPDPHVITRRLLPKLTGKDKTELVLTGLVAICTEEIRFARTPYEAGKSCGDRAYEPPQPGPSRWQQSMPERVNIAGKGWQLLAECGVEDLITLAGQYSERAAANAARATEYRELARLLEASGCATVGDMRAREEEEKAA